MSVIQYKIRFDDEPSESAVQMRIVAFGDAHHATNDDELPNVVVQRRITNDATTGASWEDCGDRVPPGVLGRMAMNAFLAYTLPGTNRHEERDEDSVAAIRAAEDARRRSRPPRWASPDTLGLGAPEILVVDLGEFVEPRAAR